MATKTRTEVDVHCDRCGRRLAKMRERVGLTVHGPTCEPGAGPESIRMVDLCKPCETSLRNWWARGGKDEEEVTA